MVSLSAGEHACLGWLQAWGHRLSRASALRPPPPRVFGYVSIDDSEIMMASQSGIAPYPDSGGFFEMGGRRVQNEAHMVTEGAIRRFYEYYRSVMGV